MKWVLSASVMIAMVALSGAAAEGQTGASTPQARTNAPAAQPAEKSGEFDIGLSAYRTFTSAVTGTGVTETPSNSAGGMLEARYIASRFLGFEMTYSYNPANEKIAPAANGCGYACATPTQNIGSKGSILGLDYVVSEKYGHLRPFLVGGIGFLIDEPNRTTFQVNDVIRADYIFGGGVDWGFTPHLGLRLQYRDNLYKAPNVSTIFPATGQFTQSSEPMGGVYYQF